jgi:hypothetical protein
MDIDHERREDDVIRKPYPGMLCYHNTVSLGCIIMFITSVKRVIEFHGDVAITYCVIVKKNGRVSDCRHERMVTTSPYKWFFENEVSKRA